MSNRQTHLLFVYEPAQVPRVQTHAEGKTVVALDYEVELDLKKQGIEFVSLADVAVSPDGDRALLEHTRALALGWYSTAETAFLEYDGIKLGEQHEVALLYYIQTVFYWAAMLGQVLSKYPGLAKVSIFESLVYVTATVDPTGVFKERSVTDVAQLLCARLGVSCEIIPAPRITAAGRLQAVRAALIQYLVWLVTVAVNAAVTVQRPRSIQLFATDPWVRLEPFVKDMRDVGLVMSRRSELLAMGWRNIWRTRARFHHRLDFVDHETRARAIAQQWNALGAEPTISKGFVYNNVSLWSVVRQALDCIVKEHTEEAIATIENTKKLFAHYRVNCVLLFASTKGYNNIIARVAERMNIPSIELQHALVNNEKSLVHCRLNSRYLASYGPLINRIYESWGVEPWRLQQVGSPRFDQYASSVPRGELAALNVRLGLQKGRCTVLWGMPEISYTLLEYGNYTGYEVKQVLEDVADIQRNLSLRILFRPRLSFRRSLYAREISRLFGEESRLVPHEDLRSLFAISDIVLSGTSTMAIEAMLMHKPVVLYIPKILDHDLKEFWESGAVLMARTKEELLAHMQHLAIAENRAQLVARGDAFVRGNFMLDGGSAERVAALLRRVAGMLEGERVRLEPLHIRHVSEEYASWFNDPETTKYTRHGERVMTRKDIEEYVARVQDSPTDYVFAMRAKDGAHIGNITLQKLDPTKREAEFAIILGKHGYGGKGLATGAGKLLLRYGFGPLGLRRIYCGTMEGNIAMQRLAKRLGFRQEGVRTRGMLKGGKHYDVIEYSMWAENFKP